MVSWLVSLFNLTQPKGVWVMGIWPCLWVVIWVIWHLAMPMGCYLGYIEEVRRPVYCEWDHSL